MTFCDEIDFIGYIERHDNFSKIKDHIEKCPACAKKLKEMEKLTAMLVQIKEKDIVLPNEPLPFPVKELVTKRKNDWQEKSAAKTAGKIGYENSEKEEKIIKLITKRDETSFLKAAFPDDLLKGKRKEDKDKDD